jgi:hypothetical protein
LALQQQPCVVVGVPKSIDNDFLLVGGVYCRAGLVWAGLGELYSNWGGTQQMSPARGCMPRKGLRRLPQGSNIDWAKALRGGTPPQSQLDKCFGFDTAVEQAQLPLLAAKTEASSALRGIGLVKVGPQ